MTPAVPPALPPAAPPEAPADPAARPDLHDEDVAGVVRAFYAGIEADPVLGRYFAGLDWEAHLPRMVDFWSSVVFYTGRYHGRPFDPHAALAGLAPAHFDRWLARFHATVDAGHTGEAAERMKAKATSIATLFRFKLGLDPV